jgi:hypothetical protein
MDAEVQASMVDEGSFLQPQESVAREVARRAGVDLEGVTILVIDDPEYQKYMRSLRAIAVTPSELGDQIHLMPEAFASMEALARTLGHERNHIAQLKLHGSPDTAACELWEEASRLVEDQYVAYLRGGLA